MKRQVGNAAALLLLGLLLSSCGTAGSVSVQERTATGIQTEATADNNTTEYEVLPMPENPTDMETYFWESADVIEVIDVESSEDVMTEEEARTLFLERGFGLYRINYDYEMDGTFVDNVEVEENSDVKHPMYKTYHMTNSGDVWTIFIVNGTIIANPVSYNLKSERGVQLIVSETEMITSYDDEASQFYVTIPYDTSLIVECVDTIDAKTLNDLTMEELDAL